jgi:hypothetical protein
VFERNHRLIIIVILSGGKIEYIPQNQFQKNEKDKVIGFSREIVFEVTLPEENGMVDQKEAKN